MAMLYEISCYIGLWYDGMELDFIGRGPFY